jgi:hypothetical protein
MGLSFKGIDSFTAIPGLKGYWDGRYGVTLTSDKISLVRDLSSESSDISTNKTDNRPAWENDKWINYQSNGSVFKNLVSARRDYKFLHNGSPFGVYCIANFQWFVGGTNYRCIETSPNGDSTGCFVRFAASESSGRFQFEVKSGTSVVRSVSIGNLLNTGNTNSRVFPNTYTFSHLFLGANKSNNQVLRFDSDSIVVTTTDTSILSEYSQNDHINFTVGRNNTTQIFKFGIVLFYDFTGFNDSQITVFDTRIRALLEQNKPSFL